MANIETRKATEKYLAIAYNQLTEKYFGELYEYCYQTGSFVYGGGTPGKSDLDIAVVFKDAVSSMPKADLLGRLDPFIDGYLQLHKEVGYSPDTVFPGEYITISMVNDAIKGRGFHVSEDGNLYLPKASTEYFLEDSERWYRAWLSQSAFNVFLKGDRLLWEDNKKRGWQTLLLFKGTTDLRDESFTIDDCFKVLRIYGVHNDYYKFREIEEPFVLEALEEACRAGFFRKQGPSFIANSNLLDAHHRTIAKRIANKSIRQSSLLLDMEETLRISKQTQEKWKILNNEIL
jgi:hypothetical protein